MYSAVANNRGFLSALSFVQGLSITSSFERSLRERRILYSQRTCASEYVGILLGSRLEVCKCFYLVILFLLCPQTKKVTKSPKNAMPQSETIYFRIDYQLVCQINCRTHNSVCIVGNQWIKRFCTEEPRALDMICSVSELHSSLNIFLSLNMS